MWLQMRLQEERVRCMAERRNMSVNGHFQHLVRREARKEKSARRGERTGRGEKDVTMQSAPSAQRLRCGLAPSSQSQPDPHIAFIYLWKGVSGGGGGVMGIEGGERKWERVTEGEERGVVEEEREEQVFCVYSHRVAARNFRPHKRFTFVIFADPVPCKRLMREMMN